MPVEDVILPPLLHRTCALWPWWRSLGGGGVTASLVTPSPSFAVARYVRQTIVTAVCGFSWCGRGADGVRRQGGSVVVPCMLRWGYAWGGPRAQFLSVAQSPVPGGGGVDSQGARGSPKSNAEGSATGLPQPWPWDQLPRLSRGLSRIRGFLCPSPPFPNLFVC